MTTMFMRQFNFFKHFPIGKMWQAMLCNILLTSMCALILAQQIEAQKVYVDTSTDFDEENGVIYGSATILADYRALVYQDVCLSAELRSEDNRERASDSVCSCGGRASTDLELRAEAWADTEYTTEADYKFVAPCKESATALLPAH